MTTQAEIRQRHKELMEKREDAQDQVERICAELRCLERRCDHPAKFRTCHMGESCWHCPDCGWED